MGVGSGSFGILVGGLDFLWAVVLLLFERRCCRALVWLCCFESLYLYIWYLTCTTVHGTEVRMAFVVCALFIRNLSVYLDLFAIGLFEYTCIQGRSCV